MSSPQILMVGDPALLPELTTALSEAGLEPSIRATSDEVLAAATDAAAVVVAGGGPDLPRGVANLVKALRPANPPIVVRLAAKDPALRDACLIHGAHDVSVEPAPEDLARRVFTAVDGWHRGGPKRALQTNFRAQRGRQTFELPVTELDASGCLVAKADGLTDGELLRLGVPLPTGELVVWGRVAMADEALGVRFLALGTEDRERLVAAIQAKPKTAPGASAPPPVMAPRVPTPVVAGPPVAARSAPPTPLDAPTESASAPPAPPAVAEVEPAPARATDAPFDIPVEPPAPLQPTEADVLAGLLETALENRRWPAAVHDPEASLLALRTAATTGLAPSEERAPASETVTAFLRTCSPLERRVFDAAPPAEFPDPMLAARCLGLRLRLFAWQQDAEEKLVGPLGKWVIEDALLQPVFTEAKAADGELQKICDGFMARGEAGKIKDVTQFRNALNKAVADVKACVSRLRGEQLAPASRAVFLDVAPDEADGPTTWKKDPPKVVEGRSEPKPVFAGFEAPPEVRRRRRLVASVVVLVALAVVAVLGWPTPPKVLAGSDFGVRGVAQVVISPQAAEGDASAEVRVTSDFSTSDADGVRRLRLQLHQMGVRSFVVFGPDRTALATSRTAESDPLNVIRAQAPAKKDEGR